MRLMARSGRLHQTRCRTGYLVERHRHNRRPTGELARRLLLPATAEGLVKLNQGNQLIPLRLR
jgi:hypothetical protein